VAALTIRFTESGSHRKPLIRPVSERVVKERDFLGNFEVQVSYIFRDVLNNGSICERRAVGRHAGSTVEVCYLLPVRIQTNMTITVAVILFTV